MTLTRRTFMKTGTNTVAAVALGMASPRVGAARMSTPAESIPPIRDPQIKTLVQRALDAAQGAGATYADVRMTHTFDREIGSGIADHESMVVGVRSLVDGYWGFASSSLWSLDELSRLGRESVHQAQCAARGGRERFVELAPSPIVQDGHWETPIKIDPFEIYPTEILDFFEDLRMLGDTIPGVLTYTLDTSIEKQEKAFGSTTGSYLTQKLYRTSGHYFGRVTTSHGIGAFGVDTLSPAGMGWELFRDQPLFDLFREACEEMRKYLMLPAQPVEVGRYNAVFDASTVARLLSPTIGGATELDRVMGYEANAGGTSYLSDPMTTRKSFKIGTPLLSVTANRTELGGVATVRWDDDGVPPVPLQLVQDGVLRNFQTVRESAGWLKESYSASGDPFQSSGNAYAQDALYAPLTHSGNLVMAPGNQNGGLRELYSHVETGIMFQFKGISMDFQLSNGYGIADRATMLRKGTPVARLNFAGILFRSTELWKNCIAIGGAESARRYGLWATKGEPQQISYHSVTAVPVAFKDVTVIDVFRKA